MKKCSKCGKEKSLGCFHNDKQKSSGKNPACKVCVNARVRRFMANPDQREKKRDYDKDPAKAAEKQRRRKQPKNRSVELEYIGKLSTRLDAKANAANAHARRLGSNLRINGEEVKNLFDSHGYCCYYCDMQSTDPSVMTLDHVVPFARGGQNTIQNCVPACAACNTSKKDRLESEFNNG
jgi:5-methylcytosine-specific restriction endonuclease McrA